jgi:hypothetical protein
MNHAARYNEYTSRFECSCGETFADLNAHQRHLAERSPVTPVKHQITYHRNRATFRCSCGVFESESSYVTDQHLASFGLDAQAAAASARAFDVSPAFAHAVLPETRPLEQRLPEIAYGTGGAHPAKHTATATPTRSWIHEGPELNAFMAGFTAGREAARQSIVHGQPDRIEESRAKAWNTYTKERIERYGMEPAWRPVVIGEPLQQSVVTSTGPNLLQTFNAANLADGIDRYADRLDLSVERIGGTDSAAGRAKDSIANFARHLAQLIRESGGGS